VAAERGHEVALYDKAPQVGGLLPMAAFIKGTTPPGTEDLTLTTDYYKTQLKKLGVKVQLSKEADISLVEKLKPDAVIVAVGGEPLEPHLDVKTGANVVTTEQLKKQAERFVRLTGPRLMSALTKLFLPVGKKVAVVGSDLAALEAVEFLAKRGKEVTVIDENEQMGEGMLMLMKMPRFLLWMQAKNISAYNGVKYQEVAPEGIKIVTREGEKKVIEADTVLVVNKYRKNTKLYEALQGKVSELYLIGDAKSDERGYIRGAINDGARIGLAV
jgi:2,4-dienoyl-CoA reductase (NADPH2)